VAVIAPPAESGSHRAMSLYQLDGSRCARIGITNSRPMIEVMVAAVCRKIAPAANANRPHKVTYSALPITARSTSWSDSEAFACVLASSAWPRKNATKAATSVTTRATMAKTSALAAYTVIRLGIAVSEVLIIPVEYSAVSTIAPNTTMTSCPR
jgi:hypothetical protein